MTRVSLHLEVKRVPWDQTHWERRYEAKTSRGAHKCRMSSQKYTFSRSLLARGLFRMSFIMIP